MNFKQGEPIMVEVESTGYRWEGTVVAHNKSDLDANFDEDVIISVQGHPAYEKDGRILLLPNSGVAYGPMNNKKFDVKRIWRPTDL